MQLNEKGTVYLASTESELKKGWLKCGITTRETKTRISKGNVASVREKYELLFATDTKFFRELEKYMHEKYENQKEWIKVSLPEAVAEINRYLKERETGKIKYKKFKPKKHQKDAIDSVVNEFQKPIYGASVKGNSIFSRELPKKASYVFGSESHGISKSLSNQLTGELSIPNLREGINKAESLNVANSTAIFLSELFR